MGRLWAKPGVIFANNRSREGPARIVDTHRIANLSFPSRVYFERPCQPEGIMTLRAEKFESHCHLAATRLSGRLRL
jgi:hypothetical protein